LAHLTLAGNPLIGQHFLDHCDAARVIPTPIHCFHLEYCNLLQQQNFLYNQPMYGVVSPKKTALQKAFFLFSSQGKEKKKES
jgi:hypothetical protein